MIDVIICIGIVSNDNYDLLRKFKALKADILINGFVTYKFIFIYQVYTLE
jgi:hypothetical protein